MIKHSCIENIKNISLLDIAEGMGIGGIKRSGKNHTLCCPFHSERTPSFSINIAKNIGTCFGGCGTKVSNAIDFVMKYRKMEFYEAAHEAARIGNITLEYDESWTPDKRDAYQKEQEAKKQIFAALKTANAHFQKMLKAQPQSYLADRSYSADTLKHFEVGYAPANMPISKHEDFKNFSTQTLLDSSLIRGEYKSDYFRNRIVFPLYSRGRIAGFAARTPGNDKPKYINSSNDEKYGIFNKSKILYNIDKAATHIHKQHGFVLAEGYTDVWSLWQSGIQYAIATCGVALTDEHIKLMLKYTSRITLMRDADPAGQAATLDEIAELLKHNIEVQVLQLPTADDGSKTDPDSYRRNKGELELRNFVENGAVDWYVYMQRVFKQQATKEPEQVKTLLKLACSIPDAFEHEYRLNNLIEDYKKYKTAINKQAADLRNTAKKKGKTAITRTVKNGKLKLGNGKDPINIQNVDHYEFDNVEAFYKKFEKQIGNNDFKFRTGFYTQSKNGNGQQFELLREEYENNRVKHREFWFEKEITKGPNAGQTRTIINKVNYLDFLQKNGYYNVEVGEKSYQLMKIAGNIVSPIADSDIVISNFVKHYLRNLKKNDAAWGAFLNNPSLTKPNTFSKLDMKKPDIALNAFDCVTLYFKNCIVEISPDDVAVRPISDLQESDSIIWESQIIQRTFEYVEDVTESDFFRFFALALTKEEVYKQFFTAGIAQSYKDRIDEVESEDSYVNSKLRLLYGAMSAQGYIARRVKDPEEAVIISYADEQLANRFDRNGRNGKSILAGKHFKESGFLKVHFVPNSKWNNSDPRKFEGIETDTQLVNFQDIEANPKHFALDMIFEPLTDDWIIERRYVGSLYLPFATSPNMVIDSNGIIKGKGIGGSYEDRIYRIPISNYFSSTNKPTRITEKNRRFFSAEWSEWQWNAYFSFIIQCIQLNLYIKRSRRYKEKSLPPIDIAGLRLREMQERGYPIWLTDFFDALPMGEWFKRKSTFETLQNDANYKEDIREFTVRAGKQITITPYRFKEWFQMWVNYKNYNLETKKQAGVEYWMLSTKEVLL